MVFFLLGEAVWKVFEAATKQKSWDHFTKAQRKNIAQWHNSIKDVSTDTLFGLLQTEVVCWGTRIIIFCSCRGKSWDFWQRNVWKLIIVETA